MLRIAFIALTAAGIFAIFSALCDMAHDVRAQAATFQALAYSQE